jgi:hypothetical protein
MHMPKRPPRQYATGRNVARRLALRILAGDAMAQAIEALKAGRRVTAVHCHTGRAIVETAPADTGARHA